MRRLPLLVLLAGLCVVPLAAGQGRDGLDPTIESVALGGEGHALIVLPPDYDTSGLSYPVVYFLHGLPATESAYRTLPWIAQALSTPAILVFPQGARSGDSDPEYRDWGPGRDWETFVAQELPDYVDANFRTIASRAGRAIMGVSAGGYGAAAIGLSHLARYSVIESWSGYFHATGPSGKKTIAAGPNSNVHYLVLRLRSQPAFLGFYVGRGDDRFRDENELLDRELSKARIPHAFAEYPGGHESTLWRTHAKDWLALALVHLAPAA